MILKTKQILSLILILLIIFTLLFICGNSMKNREESTELSMGLLDKLKPLLSAIGIEPEGDHVLRKLAHFGEFALLGLELAFYVLLNWGRAIRAFIVVAMFSFAAAAVDRSIKPYLCIPHKNLKP